MLHIYLAWAVFAFDLFVRLYFCLRIIQRRLPVGTTWAWLSLILFLPAIGTVLYLLIGEYRLGPRRRRRLAQSAHEVASLSSVAGQPGAIAALPEPARSVAKTAGGLFSAPLMTGNDIELLGGADAAFPRLIADIDAAKESLDMEFYIWSDGGRADLFGEALIRASQRGVRCRVLVDQMGSDRFLKGEMARRLKEGGVDLRAALPSGFLRSLIARPDLRVHRKIMVIDGTLAYTGSMNLADPIFFKREAHVGQWVDALCRLRGPAVQALSFVFLTDWSAETGQDFLTLQQSAPFRNSAQRGSTQIQCLPSGPAIKSAPIEEILILSLYCARQELILTTPYFVPSEALLYALTGAARRGVKTTLIVPAKVDSRLIQYAGRAFLQELAEAGVNVQLYNGGLLHTKSITIDGEVSLFGSLNMDPRSLRINFEITLSIYDKAFTQDLRALQKSYLDQASRLDLKSYQGRTHRLLEDVARLAEPLL
ncbi:MAG: cardiolipin synthase [Bdellovibrionales bacterium]|nr:cardiolipin synthase [Bdellovibrionales bacterium]